MLSKALTRRKLFSLVTVFFVALALPAAAAFFFVYPPFSWPNGRPYQVHAANWWKWAAAQTVETSAILDETGENCGVGQTGLNWFLAGSFSGEPVTRDCTIPGGRTLIFPVLNGLYGAYPEEPAEMKTEEFLRSQLEYIEDATNLEVEIDGQPVSNVARFYEESVIFSLTLPADNIFGEPAGRVISPAVDAGYYLALAPLTPGRHTIHFHGEVDGFVVDVTYNLRIKLLPF